MPVFHLNATSCRYSGTAGHKIPSGMNVHCMSLHRSFPPRRGIWSIPVFTARATTICCKKQCPLLELQKATALGLWKARNEPRRQSPFLGRRRDSGIGCWDQPKALLWITFFFIQLYITIDLYWSFKTVEQHPFSNVLCSSIWSLFNKSIFK